MTSYEENQVKGQKAEIYIALKALEKGFTLSKPLMPTCRYDYILDDGISLKRIQVKYCGAKAKGKTKGAVFLNLEKKRKNGTTTYNSNEIDLILVYIPQINNILSFNKDLFSDKKGFQIRLERSKNKQKYKVIWYEDYIW